MTAQGKITASRVQTGDRILVQTLDSGAIVPAVRKTGTDIQVARVTGKTRTPMSYMGRRTWTIHTTAGDLTDLQGIQTMWLAPEDPAGIKRAHVEALKEDQGRKEEAARLEAAEAQAAHEARQRAAVGAVPAFTSAPVAEEEAARLEAARAERALKAIGGCWAGGTLTGKALKAYADKDYKLALSLAADQKLLQEENPEEAVHPEERASRGRPETRTAREPRETMGQVAVEVRELIQDGQTPELAAALVLEVKDPAPVSPLERDLQMAAYAQAEPRFPEGTPEYAAYAEELRAELKKFANGEEPYPYPQTERAFRVQPRDVVTIHRGTDLWEVLEVVPDSSRDNLTGEVADHTMARVARITGTGPLSLQWLHVDLLHVRQPVARVQTVEVTQRVRQTQEVFRAQGYGRLVAVRTIQYDSRRLPVPTLVEVPSFPVGQEPLLREGEAIVVDGRCFALRTCENGAHLILEPAPHRDRVKAQPVS